MAILTVYLSAKFGQIVHILSAELHTFYDTVGKRLDVFDTEMTQALVTQLKTFKTAASSITNLSIPLFTWFSIATSNPSALYCYTFLIVAHRPKLCLTYFACL